MKQMHFPTIKERRLILLTVLEILSQLKFGERYHRSGVIRIHNMTSYEFKIERRNTLPLDCRTVWDIVRTADTFLTTVDIYISEQKTDLTQNVPHLRKESIII